MQIVNRSWPIQLLKVVTVLAIAFGATGAGQVTVRLVKQEIAKQANRDFEAEVNAMREATAKADVIVAAARKAGENYSPADYARDARQLLLLGYNSSYNEGPDIVTLQDIVRTNVDADHYSYEDVQSSCGQIVQWYNDPRLDQDREEARAAFKQAGGWRMVGWWLVRTYCLSTPLILLLFMLRLFESGQRLNTMRGCVRLAIAVAAWPIYVWSFPRNRVGELIVEAELRRHGDGLRRLTRHEQQVVQLVNERGTRQTLRAIRLRRGRQRRSWTMGLLLVLFCLLLVTASMGGLNIVATAPPRVDTGRREDAPKTVRTPRLVAVPCWFPSIDPIPRVLFGRSG